MNEPCPHNILDKSTVLWTTVYACRDCWALFTTKLEPYEITVKHGRPETK